MTFLVQNEPDRRLVSRNAKFNRVRVVHLVSTLNMGGLEKVVYDLTRLADRDQFDVRVVCLGEVGALERMYADIDVPVTELRVLGNGILPSIRALVRVLRRNPPDVLHTHNPSPHIAGAVAARCVGTKVVVHTKHGRNYPDEFRKVWANRIATWFSDQVVAVSQDSADVATKIERVASKKVLTIRNGIDLDRFSNVSSNAYRSPLRAIHVARLMYPTKDQKTLLRATRLVVDQEPQFQLEIVGDGPHRDEIEQLCDELNLRENVRFLGFRDNVQHYLAEAGLFVLSSLTEGLSLTLLEAMAMGLPIVATHVGGNPEVVDDGTTGLLVPPQSPRAMADAIVSLIRDPNRMIRMGLAGRARVEERFDLRKVIASYESLYMKLLIAKGFH